MKLFWDDTNEDIGSHYLKLVNDDGKEIDEVWLVDWTCDFRKTKQRPERQKNVTFEYSYCNGFSSHREITDNISLNEAKVVVEKWLINLYMGKLEITKRQLDELAVICSYFGKTSSRLLTDKEIDCFNGYVKSENVDVAFGNSDWCDIYKKVVGDKVSEYARAKIETYFMHNNAD